MRIRRVAFIVMVGLAPVTASLASDDAPRREPVTDAVAWTVALRPAALFARETSPPPSDDNGRRKALAILILMLKEGRGAR